MSTKFTDDRKIYKNYRNTLKHLKQDSAYNRAAARKQESLKRTADKHGVRISEVKSIVREHDESNGITHEHPEPYMRIVRFIKDSEELEAKYNHLPDDFCPVCENDEGVHGPDIIPVGKEGNEVEIRSNPFLVEIHGELRPMYSCKECHTDLARDI